MSAGASKKGPIVDPGICRCCGTLKKCRLLNVEYEYSGVKEVYSDMFVDCFGLVLSHLDGEQLQRLICATCVVRLRDATAFRQQVLRCEEQLLSATLNQPDTNHFGEDLTIKVEVEVKREAESIVSGDLYANDVTAEDQLSDDGVDADIEIVEQAETAPTGITLESSTERTARLNMRARRTAASVTVPGVVKKLCKKEPKHIKKTKKELPRKRPKSPPVALQRRLKRPPIVDKDINTVRNILTIIENSYVTPFIALFSDYHCVYCREMFLEPEKLREHTLEHDPRTFEEFLNIKKIPFIDVVRIDCRLCHAHIDSIDSFKQHITSVHNKVIFKDVDSEFIKFKLKTGTLNCLDCDKTFSFFQALKKHMAEHYGAYICDVCGAHYFEERHLIFHKKSHNSNRSVEMFPCDQCDKSFRSKNSRNFHISRIHKNEAAYPCNKCDEIFISYHMRYRHKMTAHGEKREFPCEGCDKVYDCRKTLREHYQRRHLQLLRHECTLCDKKFYLPSALRDHMTSHTGERLYRCDYCGKSYPRKKALKVHLQSHSTEKKYKCTLCPSAYTQANNFKNHMKSKHPIPAEFNDAFR